MGRRRRYTDGGGSSTADEIADGIGAFTSTFNTMNQAFDRADQMKMAKEDHAYEVQERERAEQDRLDEEEFAGLWDGFSKGHISPLIKIANKKGVFGEGAVANGYKIDPDEQGNPVIYFNVKSAEGKEGAHRVGSIDEVGAALMSLAPTKFKSEMLKNRLAYEMDPGKKAQLEGMLLDLEAKRTRNQYDPQIQDVALQRGRLDLAKTSEDLDYSRAIRPHSISQAEAAAQKARQEASLDEKYGEMERQAGLMQKTREGKPAAPRWFDPQGNQYTEQMLSRFYENRGEEDFDLAPLDYLKKMGFSQQLPSATGLSGGVPSQTSAPAPQTGPQTGPAPGVVSGAMGSAAPAAEPAQAPASRFQPGKVYKVKDKQGNVLEKTWTGTGWK